MICPHCHKLIDKSDVSRGLAGSGVNAGRKKKMRPCPKCSLLFGAREMRKHIPACLSSRQPSDAAAEQVLQPA